MAGEATERRRKGSRDDGYATGRATKESILDAAYRLFAENGYAGTSVREIARRSGISHPTLLHHYPNKSDLLVAALERRDDAVRVSFPPDADLAEVLADMVAGARRNEASPGLLRLFTLMAAEAGDPDHPAHEFFVRRTNSFVDMLVPVIGHAQAGGSLTRTWDARSLATTIMALWDGLQLDAPLVEPCYSVADLLQASFEAILGRPLPH